MTTESSRSSGDYYTPRHQEALELEVSLLEATLRRNRSSQQRTLYFRRAQMAYKCCLQQHHRLDRLWAEWQSLLRDELPTQLELVLRKRKQQKQRDDRWETAVQTPSTTTLDAEYNDNKHLLQVLRPLCARTTHGVAECRSRIEHYARAATAEIVRGFFLPLLTVLTGCLARIRVLLQRLQRQVAQTIRQEVLLKYDADGVAGNNELWKLVRPLLENVVETVTTTATADAETMRFLQKRQDGNWTRSELTAASLRSLGIQYSTTSSTVSASATPQSMVDNDGTGKSSPENDDLQDNEDVKKPSTAECSGGGTEEALSLTMSTTTATNVDDNDIGESVAGVATMLRDDDTFIAVSATNNSQRTSKPNSVHKDDSSLDRNAVVLQKIKEQRVASDQKQKKQDRKEKRRAATGSSKPSKKGKKKKGGDFFDALFG